MPMTPAELKEARRKLGLSTAEMSEMLGFGSSRQGDHVRRLEMDPSRNTARGISETVRRLVQAYLDGYRPSDWIRRD